MEGRDIGCAGIAELPVDLVGEEEEVIFLDQVAYLQHLFHRIEVARGVVGIADEDAFGAGGNQFLELLDRGEREAVVYARRHGDDLGTGRDGEGHIVGIGRLGHDNLVAGVEASHEREQHGLRAS